MSNTYIYTFAILTNIFTFTMFTDKFRNFTYRLAYR